jgi:succinoglycan biosynthesis transport protein ExoP
MKKRRVSELSDYWEIFLRRRWWIIIPSVLIAGGTMAVVSKLPKTYLSQTTILVEPQKVPADFVKPTVTTNVNNRLQIISQEILSRTHLQRIIDEFGLYRNTPALDRVLNVLLRRGKRTEEEIVDAMRKDITVETFTDDQDRSHALGAFKISYQGYDPAVTQQVTRELAALFIEENVKVRERQAEGTTNFIDDELEKARLSLEQQEQRIKDFKTAHMGSLPEQEAANLQLLGQLQMALQVNEEALSRAQSEKVYQQSLLAGVRAQEVGSPTPHAKSELETLRDQLTQAKAKWSPLYPDVIRLEAEVKALEQRVPPPGKPPTNAAAAPPSQELGVDQIRGQIALLDNEIKQRTRQETEIEKRIKAMQARVEALPAIEQQMSELNRDYEISKTNYQSLLKKKNDSAMAAEMERRAEGEQFRVLDPASYPEKPYQPDVAQLSLLGVLGGILCGCGLGLFVEFQDRSIRSARDATFYLATPALASLPLLNHSALKKASARRLPGANGGTSDLNLNGEGKVIAPTALTAMPEAGNGQDPRVQAVKFGILERLVVARNQLDDQDNAYAREQFRMIRTRLVELMRVRPIRSIMVTSATRGEGKTWVSANLAYSMSTLQNLRVLLVDADLRGAGLGKFLGVEPWTGLSNYLVNGCDLKRVQGELKTNLSVVATLSLQEGSAELLSGKRMRDFLEEALRDHDLVVLDTPPVLSLADAQVLAALVDAAIVVVRAGSSNYDLVRSAIDLLKPKAVGVVVNGVPRLPVKSYYYGSPQKNGRNGRVQ